MFVMQRKRETQCEISICTYLRINNIFDKQNSFSVLFIE